MINFKQKPYPTYFKPAKAGDLVNMFIEEIESIPENSNPFHYDAFRMGVPIASDVMAMFSTPLQDSALVDFRLIRQATGQVFKIWSTPKVQIPEPFIDITEVATRTLGVISLSDEEYPMNVILPTENQLRRLGGAGPGHIYFRDENGGPVMFESKLGKFDIPTYLGYGSYAILLTAIPYSMVGDKVVMTDENINELRRLLPDWLEEDIASEFVNEVIWFIQKDLPNIK